MPSCHASICFCRAAAVPISTSQGRSGANFAASPRQFSWSEARTDHQRADRSSLLHFAQQQRQRLHRLAKAHVVRQNAAKARVAERAQPRQPPVF